MQFTLILLAVMVLMVLAVKAKASRKYATPPPAQEEHRATQILTVKLTPGIRQGVVGRRVSWMRNCESKPLSHQLRHAFNQIAASLQKQGKKASFNQFRKATRKMTPSYHETRQTGTIVQENPRTVWVRFGVMGLAKIRKLRVQLLSLALLLCAAPAFCSSDVHETALPSRVYPIDSDGRVCVDGIGFKHAGLRYGCIGHSEPITSFVCAPDAGSVLWVNGRAVQVLCFAKGDSLS